MFVELTTDGVCVDRLYNLSLMDNGWVQGLVTRLSPPTQSTRRNVVENNSGLTTVEPVYNDHLE